MRQIYRVLIELERHLDQPSLIEGDAVRVLPGVRHGYRNISGAPVELLVWLTPGGFEQLFVTYQTGQPNLDEDGFVAEATGRFNSQFEKSNSRAIVGHRQPTPE